MAAVMQENEGLVVICDGLVVAIEAEDWVGIAWGRILNGWEQNSQYAIHWAAVWNREETIDYSTAVSYSATRNNQRLVPAVHTTQNTTHSTTLAANRRPSATTQTATTAIQQHALPTTTNSQLKSTAETPTTSTSTTTSTTTKTSTRHPKQPKHTTHTPVRTLNNQGRE